MHDNTMANFVRILSCPLEYGMGLLVRKVTVPLRASEIPEIHVAVAWLPIGRCLRMRRVISEQDSLASSGNTDSKVGVVGAGRFLDGHLDGIAPFTPFASIVVLEVESSFSKAILVEEILRRAERHSQCYTEPRFQTTSIRGRCWQCRKR